MVSRWVVFAVVAVVAAVAAAAAFVLARRHLVRVERFSGAGAAKGAKGGAEGGLAAKLKAFTAQERELFKNLQDNKYTTNQIDDLIQEGVLNSKVVDKFLGALNVV